MAPVDPTTDVATALADRLRNDAGAVVTTPVPPPNGGPDLTGAVELAPRVWWVGSLLPDDQFQCHVYLIEQGDQSVLIDPGSALIADELVRKIDEVVGVDHVRWLVCSHSDPDIIGALPALVARGLHPDATIVTHWRDEALIRHCGTRLPFWRVDEHEWSLPLEDRTLQFVFTPYVHFAGAFCTFDEASGTLFSSDLFGGFTDDDTLFARSVDTFDGMRDFHEHYMPSREILTHSIERLRELPMERIAPQHGHIIPKHLIAPIMDRLSQLECGIYLLARDDPGLEFLLEANRTIREVIKTLVAEAQFPVIARRLAEIAGQFLGSTTLEFWARAGPTALHFDSEDDFAGRVTEPTELITQGFAGVPATAGRELIVPLRASLSGEVVGVIVLGFDGTPTLDRATRAILGQIADLVEVGLEREVMRRVADLDRETFYEQATHDPLTGLYNRTYSSEVAERLCATDDRTEGSQMAALMIDIDHFKRVNDTYGHQAGDRVLQRVAGAMTQAIRPGDVAVRFGGEEFLVLLGDVDGATSVAVAERIRSAVAAPEHAMSDGEAETPEEQTPAVTASVGVALRRQGETFEGLVERADVSLYRAKSSGRDQVSVAP